MHEFLISLDRYDSLLTLLFTGVVALSTVVYAALTWSLVRETRAMRQVYTDPKVDFTVRPQRPHRGIFDAWVENIGQGPAFDIRFLIEPISKGDTTKQAIKSLTSSRFISEGINYLSPNQSMDAYLENMYDEKVNRFDVKFNIIVSYSGSNGATFKDVYRIEFSEHEGGSYIVNDYLYESSKHLDKISKYIEKVIQGHASIKVDVFNNKDREMKKKESEERLNRLRQQHSRDNNSR